MSLLGLYEKIKQGCTTEEDIRVDLQKRFPEWKIPDGLTCKQEEVIIDSALKFKVAYHCGIAVVPKLVINV